MARRPQEQPATQANGPTRWQGEDAVFFHRSQIKRGTKLLWFGRTQHGAIWEVTEIITARTAKTGRVQNRKTDTVTFLRDEVLLRRVGSNEYRQVKFAYLSYTATWRLAT